MSDSPAPSAWAASGGASRLLDREPPEGYLREWTRRIAAEKEAPAPDAVSVLLFRLGAEWLALPTRLFQEVAERCPFHSLPRRPGSLAAGLVTVRGEILICVALESVLHLERPEQISGRRLLIVSRRGERLAFPVDEVATLHRYHPRELRPLPATLAEGQGVYTLGLLPWGAKTVGCLDEELLFHTLEKGLA